MSGQCTWVDAARQKGNIVAALEDEAEGKLLRRFEGGTHGH